MGNLLIFLYTFSSNRLRYEKLLSTSRYRNVFKKRDEQKDWKLETCENLLLQLNIWERQLIFITASQFWKFSFSLGTVHRKNLSATQKYFSCFFPGHVRLSCPSSHYPCLQKCPCRNLFHPHWHYFKLLVPWPFWLKQQNMEQLSKTKFSPRKNLECSDEELPALSFCLTPSTMQDGLAILERYPKFSLPSVCYKVAIIWLYD